MNSLNVQTFVNQDFGSIRTVEENGKILFCGSDVAKALGYIQPRKAIERHCKDDGMFRTVIDSLGRKQTAKFINEGNLYRLISNSKLPSAEKFESWVFDDVLPTIRQTGGYIPISTNNTDSDIMAKAILIADKTIKSKDTLIAELKPKAQMCDTFLNSKGYISLNKTAKSLNQGRNKMMAFLREQGVLFKDGNENIAYQPFINNGYFKINYVVGKDGVTHATTRVSPKGVAYIHKLINKSENARIC